MSKDIKPWHQRWFGWAVPSDKSMKAFRYVGCLLLAAPLIFGLVFAFWYFCAWLLLDVVGLDLWGATKWQVALVLFVLSAVFGGSRGD